jgi:hypothetical protein
VVSDPLRAIRTVRFENPNHRLALVDCPTESRSLSTWPSIWRISALPGTPTLRSTKLFNRFQAAPLYHAADHLGPARGDALYVLHVLLRL